MTKHYIFSYGSLINKNSLAKTIGIKNAKEAKEIIVRGYERGWRNHVHHEYRTGLGIIKKEDSKVNGVIFEIDEKYLKNLDKREYGFKRKEILNQTYVDGHLWSFFVADPKTPTKEFPIAQSYVDTVIAGCLTHNKEFAKEFVKSTVNWKFPYVNDRKNPRFPRGVKLTKETIDQIDLILDECIPQQKPL